MRTRLGALTTAVLVGVLTAPLARADVLPFYEPPTPLPAVAGQPARVVDADFYLDPLKLSKVDAVVLRVMYRSNDTMGRPIAVTGTVMTPKHAWPGQGERPLIGYAPGTQGLADRCAASRQLAEGTEDEGKFLAGLLMRGYALVLPDYQGLGTPGRHTYVNRVAQGQVVLDAVRAARGLAGSGISPTAPVGIAGYSQGGAAAAAAAELAATYAPELPIVGVAAGAAPTDLLAVGRNLDGGLYAGMLGLALSGLSAGYGIDFAPYLNERGRAMLAAVQDQCIDDTIGAFALTRSDSLTADGRSMPDILATTPHLRWAVEQQRIGRVSPTMPVLVSQSLLDDVIPFRLGEDLVRDWCRLGANVAFEPNIVPTHVGAAYSAYVSMFNWLDKRFAGERAVSGC